MVLIARMQDVTQAAVAGNSPAVAGVRRRIAEPGFPAVAKDRAEDIHSVRRELDTLRLKHEKLQQAVFEAAQVQRRLCAPRELTWGEFEIAGEIFPVRHLSGDFFKVMELDSSLGIAVGDIAGKGLTAGIWQAHVMGLIQRSARRHGNAADAVAEVNRELCLDESEPPIMALFFATIDRENDLVYCNAGLPAPLLVRQDKTVKPLEKGGPMLGAVKDAAFETGSVHLGPGDMLVAYSDGVTECRNPQDEEFEVPRLTAAARAVAGTNASRALFSTLGAVLDFADVCPPGDDLTLLVLRRRAGIPGGQAQLPHNDILAPHRKLNSAVVPKNANEKGPGSK